MKGLAAGVCATGILARQRHQGETGATPPPRANPPPGSEPLLPTGRPACRNTPSRLPACLPLQGNDAPGHQDTAAASLGWREGVGTPAGKACGGLKGTSGAPRQVNRVFTLKADNAKAAAKWVAAVQGAQPLRCPLLPSLPPAMRPSLPGCWAVSALHVV